MPDLMDILRESFRLGAKPTVGYTGPPKRATITPLPVPAAPSDDSRYDEIVAMDRARSGTAASYGPSFLDSQVTAEREALQTSLSSLDELARQSLEMNDGELVDLTDLMLKIRLGSGFYKRLLDGMLDDDDRVQAVGALGSDLTPELRDSILRQLMRTYGDPEATMRAAIAPSIPPSVAPFARTITPVDFGRSGGPATPNPRDAASYATAGAAYNPAVAALAPPAAIEQPTPEPSGPVAPGDWSLPGSTEAVNPQDYLTAQQWDVPRADVYTPQPVVHGGVFQPISQPNLLKDMDGRIIGRVNELTGGWEMVVDPTEENIRIAEESGYFSQDYLLGLQVTRNKLLAAAREAAYADENARLDAELRRSALAIQQGELDLKNALKDSEIAMRNAQARKAQIDAEVAALDLALFPERQRQMQLANTEMEMRMRQIEAQMRQQEQLFPLDLQLREQELALREQDKLLKEQQLSDLKAAADERTRLQQRREAGDKFAQAMYPTLIKALAPGPVPPPAFTELATNAGTTPEDPAAQMALTLIQNNLSEPVTEENPDGDARP